MVYELTKIAYENNNEFVMTIPVTETMDESICQILSLIDWIGGVAGETNSKVFRSGSRVITLEEINNVWETLCTLQDIYSDNADKYYNYKPVIKLNMIVDDDF